MLLAAMMSSRDVYEECDDYEEREEYEGQEDHDDRHDYNQSVIFLLVLFSFFSKYKTQLFGFVFLLNSGYERGYEHGYEHGEFFGDDFGGRHFMFR